MSLIATAETAQDIASALNKFLEPVSEGSAQITRLISECFAISSALRELANAIPDPRYRGGYASISEDVQIALRSLEYTFADVHRLFGGLGRATHLTTSASYRAVWRDIEDHFQVESASTLCMRLEGYTRFLQDLIDIVIEGVPLDRIGFEDLQDRMDALLKAQDARLEDNFNNLSLSTPVTPRQRSFERRRPVGLQPRAADLLDLRPGIPPIYRPLTQERPGVGRRRSSGIHPPLFTPNDPTFFLPPQVPEVPSSPTTTTTFSSHSSSTSSSVTHWAPRLFEQSRSSTQFKTSGPVSACYGIDTPGASSKLAEEYDKLLELPFENGDLLIRLYVRSKDQRARIHCRITRANQSRKQCCLALTSLRVERVHSSLKFSRLSQNERVLELWACLRFPSYERLVLFFCTFLAMKAEDSENRQRSTEDFELRGEELRFSGKIIDDHYEHGLRLFRDRDSGGVRLQASVSKGDLKKTPVWTAFITHHITSSRWMRKGGPKTIHLADLQRYIFTNEYIPQLGPGGEHELCFINIDDRRSFEDAIDDLAP